MHKGTIYLPNSLTAPIENKILNFSNFYLPPINLENIAHKSVKFNIAYKCCLCVIHFSPISSHHNQSIDEKLSKKKKPNKINKIYEY